MQNSVRKITMTAFLVALGIIIPIVMPVKVMIGPASFTLASHVPVFLGMFISPGVACAVALGTAFGFFVSMPIVVALRALSHVIFAVIGSYYLMKHPLAEMSMVKKQIFNFLIGIIHSLMEVVVVAIFFFSGNLAETYYDQGFIYTVVLLVGVGGIIHSMVDFNIALFVWDRVKGMLGNKINSVKAPN